MRLCRIKPVGGDGDDSPPEAKVLSGGGGIVGEVDERVTRAAHSGEVPLVKGRRRVAHLDR